MTDLRKELISMAKQWEIRTGKRKTTAASIAVGDARFLDTVENGGNFTIFRAEKMKNWFVKNTPAANAHPPPS